MTPKLAIALTIAGSDSSGGAGIQADLKTFTALGVYGASVLTALTAQNTQGVRAVHAPPAAFVTAQIDAVLDDLDVGGVKTGMLANADIVLAVAEALQRRPSLPLVVDPVMVATSGARLLKPSAIRALLDELLPLAAIVTPNLDEAEILVGHPVRTIDALRAAAREIQGRFGCAALVKGGHLSDGREAVDFFYDGRTELMLSAPFVRGVSTHGTGCTYSAAITAHLALGQNLAQAVARAKETITNSIAGSVKVGQHWALSPS